MSEANASAIDELIAALRAGDLDFANPPLETRAAFEEMLSQIPIAQDVSFDTISLGGVPGLVGSVPGAADDAALLYLHGGGYTAGSARGYSGLAAELARAGGIRPYVIDYRLAPEHPFPAALDDVESAYRALLESGVAASRIVIAGDSAGGGLVVSALLRLRAAGTALPAAALVISPWADLTCSGDSYASKADDDPSLTAEGLRASAAHYLVDHKASDPLVSPTQADLSGLPPLLIQVGSSEILLDDSVSLARAAGMSGVSVQLEVWPRMVHVWHAFSFMLDEGRQAILRAGQFMRDAVS